ncbi:ATP-binding protein [Meridianimarinicoccus sp. RP-17]|uniref:ATP-binding protein n=1 Tax=Meridianimarinicoccus zhengii TaxID=2056810 RepID=UPI000DAE5600|nr:ATP-binding protein [Phycocomes zhengii]
MTGWRSRAGRNLLRKTNVPALLAFLVVVAGWIAAETQARKNHVEAQRATIASQVALLRADLEGAVNGPIQLVRGLIAAIATEPDMDQARFADFASRLINSEPSLRNIAAAPDMVIRMMYPVEGNEQAIGLDYNSIPEQRDAALRARDLGNLVLAGPVDLVQGGQGFIGRFPVFLQTDSARPVFWGLVSAVMDLEVLYAQAGLHDDLPFSLTLTGRDATGAQGLRFLGPEVAPEDMPVIANVQLPAGTWQIAALPHGGWNTQHPQIWTIRALLALAAALILVPSIEMGRSMLARERAIAELEAANTALHHQMQELETARAAQAAAEVQLRQSQKLEAVGQLTGGVAHDFNNLLTVILGNAEMLTDALSDRDHLRGLAEMTADAAERGSELTSRLLAFSRKQPLQPRVLDVGHQITNGLEMLLRRTLPESITLQIDRGEGLWLAEIDPSQLESALLNIVLNARDAMPDGGEIRIAIRNAELDDDVVSNEPDFEPGQYVLISVTDSGHGMPEETLSRVFEPFFTTKEVGSGSGLGLSMVYGFVKQSGGHVRIRSAPDKGTSVTLYFRRSQHEEAESDVDASLQPISGGLETILVVEDDEQVREHVCANLLGLGYKVVEAENGPQAIEILEQTRDLDLLFTDVVLSGGMNGRELADMAKALRPGLKILFTSGYAEDTIVHHGRLDPDVELLSKPYRRAKLAEKIRKVLG